MNSNFKPDLNVAAFPLAYDDSGGSGSPVILLPGAGDIRSENRFLARALADAGYRVINADLPGHGESNIACAYGVAESAAALLSLIHELDCGPATVIATSFAPAAAVWAAASEPQQVNAVVAISPHLEAQESINGRILRVVMSVLLSGPWASSIWSRFYRSWYKSRAPDDLECEINKLQTMLKDPQRRKAVRETLTAHRKGMPEKIASFNRPALVIFGSADDHFPEPTNEATRVGSLLNAEILTVAGAGHYPHVEHPEIVNRSVVEFLNGLRPGS